MDKFIKHYVSAMDKTLVQRCLICGAIINDYSHAAWPSEQGPPRGFEEGYVYVRAGNPVCYTVELPEGAEFKFCV